MKSFKHYLPSNLKMAKSLLQSMSLNQCAIFFTLIFFIIFPIIITAFIPVFIFRFLVTMAKNVFRPDLGQLVEPRSALIASTDDPSNEPNWVLCVWLVLDGKLNFEQFCHNFYNNIVLKKTRTGQLHSPEFQQYFADWLGFTFWKWEENFNVKDHMRYLIPEDIEKTVTKEILRQIIKKYSWKSFSPKKSPWEFLFVPNYKENGSISPDKSVLIFRVHHGFCDGFSILHLLMKEVNNVSLKDVAKPDRVHRNVFYSMAQTLLFWIIGPYHSIKMLLRSIDTNEWHLPVDKLRKPRNTGFTQKISLDYVKDIRNKYNVSFSAVIYASLAGALRKMILTMGKTVPPNMTTAVAVPMPGHPLKLRNHFVFAFLQLPTGVEDPVERLIKVETNISHLKRSPAPLFNFGLMPVLGGTFSAVIKLFTANKYSTILTSNFPGPPSVIDFIGGGGRNRVTDMNFSAGLGEGNVGIGFCMMSYNEKIRIISIFDKNILATDELVDEFNKMVIEEMETLRMYI